MESWRKPKVSRYGLTLTETCHESLGEIKTYLETQYRIITWQEVFEYIHSHGVNCIKYYSSTKLKHKTFALTKPTANFAHSPNFEKYVNYVAIIHVPARKYIDSKIDRLVLAHEKALIVSIKPYHEVYNNNTLKGR